MSDVVGVGKPGVPAGDVLSVQGPFPGGASLVTQQRPTSSSVTPIAQSAVSVTLAVLGATRLQLSIFNNSASPIYIKWGAGASLVDFSFILFPQGFYEEPVPVDVELVSGIWPVAGAGTAQVTVKAFP